MKRDFLSTPLYVLACLCVTSVVSAGMLYVQEVTVTIANMDTTYFQNGAFSISETGGYGDVKLHGSAAYAYYIEEAVYTITPAALLSESAAPLTGVFAGGATLSLEGTLKDVATDTPLAAGSLMVAEMSADDWELINLFSNNMAMFVEFSVTGGALASGVADGDDMIVMYDFSMGAFFDTFDPLNFEDTLVSQLPTNFQLTADVPEPITLVLLGLGGALVRLRRN